ALGIWRVLAQPLRFAGTIPAIGAALQQLRRARSVRGTTVVLFHWAQRESPGLRRRTPLRGPQSGARRRTGCRGKRDRAAVQYLTSGEDAVREHSRRARVRIGRARAIRSGGAAVES